MLYDMIMALALALREQAGMGMVRLPYQVVRAIRRKYKTETNHLDLPDDHSAALLPTGAKLIRTVRKGRTAWFLSCYHYANEDGRNILLSI